MAFRFNNIVKCCRSLVDCGLKAGELSAVSQCRQCFIIRRCRFCTKGYAAAQSEHHKDGNKEIPVSESRWNTMEGGNETLPEQYVCSGDEFGKLKISMEHVRERNLKKVTNKKVVLSEVGKVNRKPRGRLREERDASEEFGNLSGSSPVCYSKHSVDDELVAETGTDTRAEYLLKKEYGSPQAYLDKMKQLVAEKKLKEALELIPHMKQNNIYPIVFNYTFLIGACGRAGYTEMAFKLLRQMLDRGFRPTCAVLTGLFNSCAESPFPDDGLRKAKYLREKVEQKNWQMNRSCYHAMIKAFGKCGDMETAFQVVDDMVAAGINPTSGTYSFLLMSCIADKEAGFTHSIEVWRKMVSKRIVPNLFSFNLLLRAVRDCGVGPEEVSSLLLQHWSSYEKRPYGLNSGEKNAVSEMLRLPNPEFSNTKLIASSEIPAESDFEEPLGANVGRTKPVKEVFVCKESQSAVPMEKIYPNIISRRPVQGPQFIDLLSIRTAADRLALLGYYDGLLEHMKSYKVAPDIKTFTLLLENLPPDTKAEDNLLSLLDTYKVIPDTDFFNILIKRRNKRQEFTSAKNVLLLITKYNLCPDVVTFGVLAIGACNMKHALCLLRDMKSLGFSPNIEIMGALADRAIRAADFVYLKYVLDVMRKADILPNERILERIEEIVEKARKIIIDKEHGKEVQERYLRKGFSEEFRLFCEYYNEWLQRMKIDVTEHPWEQYKADIRLRKSANCTI